jgi:DNA-binding LytR/AlgR family response regulator
MKYRCLIADDSMLERDKLQMMLDETGLVTVTATCEDGEEAYRALINEPVDIVFCDINMPRMNGFELFRSLREQPVFIFISSHAEHAAEGFNLDVTDFILKPVQFGRLIRSVNKAIDRIHLKKAETRTPASGQDNGYFLFRADDKLVRLHIREVACIESAGNFSKIHTAEGNSYLTLVNLRNLTAQLPPNSMMRVHRQFLVNPAHIKSIDTNLITLAGEYRIPLLAQYRQALIDSACGRVIVRSPHE